MLTAREPRACASAFNDRTLPSARLSRPPLVECEASQMATAGFVVCEAQSEESGAGGRQADPPFLREVEAAE